MKKFACSQGELLAPEKPVVAVMMPPLEKAMYLKEKKHPKKNIHTSTTVRNTS
jgi:hypothetical protein